MKYDDNMILLLPVKGSPQLVPLHHLLSSLWQPAGVDQALLSFVRTACRPFLGNTSLRKKCFLAGGRALPELKKHCQRHNGPRN